MAVNSQIATTEGSGKNVATYSISETTTKELVRQVLSTSAGVELGSAATPLQVSLANNAANATAVKVDGSAVTQPVSGSVTLVGTSPVSIAATVNVTPTPQASGGCSVSRVSSPASLGSVLVKASAGQLYGWYLYNNTASAKFVKLYNKASSPTIGSDTPLFIISIPASGGTNIEFSMGIPFGTGIGYGMTGGIADSDTTATALNDITGVLLYK